MKKILYILLVGLLVLAACDDNGDEPRKGKSPRILLEVYTGSLGGYYVFDNSGKLIFECPEGYGITNMAAEGKNWYCVMQSNSDSIFRVLKNGKLAYSTTNEIYSLCVENGDIYTLQLEWKHSDGYMWRIFKNDSQLYEYDFWDYSFCNLTVDHGDLMAHVWYKELNGKLIYWMNGKIYTLQAPEPYVSIREISKQGKDTLAVLENSSGAGLYWWMNGEFHPLPSGFNFNYGSFFRYTKPLSGLAGGVPYIAGHSQRGMAVVVNGQEYLIDAPSSNRVMKVQRHGNDVYTLTCDRQMSYPPNGHARIFKGSESVDINCKVYINNVRYPGNGSAAFNQGGDTVNLADFAVYDFVVLDK